MSSTPMARPGASWEIRKKPTGFFPTVTLGGTRNITSPETPTASSRAWQRASPTVPGQLAPVLAGVLALGLSAGLGRLERSAAEFHVNLFHLGLERVPHIPRNLG